MPTPTFSQLPVEVFISFSQEDKRLLSLLEKSLAVLQRQRIINVSHGDRIEPGKDSVREISRLMENARIILLLVSDDFLESAYSYSADLARALERHARREAQVIPIILRPCDWEGTEFNGLAALPEGARPVSSWATQKEAFASVAKAIRSLILGRVEIGTPKPAGHFKREIPALLPYLCNRVEQENELSAIFSAGSASPHRPFVCIVHGYEDECHDMYMSRLQQSFLPKLLREGLTDGLPLNDIFLPFPSRVWDAEQDFNLLRGALAEEVADRRHASDEEIAKALSQFRTPVIIYSYLSAEMWGPHYPDLLDAFINYWSVFPDLPLKTHLIVCLFVIYRKADAPHSHPAAAAARRGDGNLREYVGRLNFSGYGGNVHVVILPEMLPVALPDAENFFRGKERFAELCRLHSPRFCNVQGAIEDIRSYYKLVGHDDPAAPVPMQELANELRKVLEKHLC